MSEKIEAIKIIPAISKKSAVDDYFFDRAVHEELGTKQYLGHGTSFAATVAGGLLAAAALSGAVILLKKNIG